MKRSAFLVLLLALILGGCSDTDDGFLGPNPGSGTPPNLFSLLVRANPVALNRGELFQFAPTVAQLRVTIYDTNSQQLSQQAGPKTQTFTFEGLADGSYLVRTEGLNSSGAIVGFFDRVVTIDGQSLTTTIPGLRTNSNPPTAQFPPATGGSDFFVITQGPAAIQGGNAFSVSAQAFDNRGNPVSSQISGATLVSDGVPLTAVPTAQVTDSSGRVTFNTLSFANNAAGTTLLHIRANGVEQGTSNLVTVTPVVSANPRLNFVTLPSAAVAGQAFLPEIQVEALDANGNRITTPANINLVLGSGAPNGSVLGGTLTRAVNNGLATFPGLSLNQSGTFTISANSPGFDGTVSPSIRVAVPPNPRLNFVAVPTTGTTNQALAPDVQVEALDGNGVRVPRDVDITLSLAPGAQNGTALNGNLTIRTVQGVAVFPSLSLTQADTVNLRATASGFDSADSISIAIADPAGFFTTLELVSRTTAGAPSMNGLIADHGGNVGETPAISADGRYVAFVNQSQNMAGGQFPPQVYRYDRQTDTLTLCSKNTSGEPSQSPGTAFDSISISANGRFVCFGSTARDLVAGVSFPSVYVYDADLDTVTAPMNLPTSSFTVPDMSDDGTLITCTTDSRSFVPPGSQQAVTNVIVFERENPSEIVVLRPTPGPHQGSIRSSKISGDGRKVALVTRNRLVAADTDDEDDIYLFDLGIGPGLPNASPGATLVSQSTPGDVADSQCFGQRLSEDGRFVSFVTISNNLVPPAMDPDPNVNDFDLFVRDVQAGTTEIVSFGEELNRLGNTGHFSDDGRYIVFTASEPLGPIRNGAFIMDRNTRETRRVSLSVSGDITRETIIDVSISGDGRFVTYETGANLVPGALGGTYTVRNPFLFP